MSKYKVGKLVWRNVRNIYVGLIFLAFLPQTLAAYLDPGTGSMLFSALLGLISTLYFTFRSSVFTLRIKLAGLLGRQHAQEIREHSIVFFSEGKQYWNCFWPILQELETRQIEASYWTMDPEDLGLEQGFQYIHPRFIGTGYAAFAQMNTLQADVCVMTTPGLDVLQIRRSKKVVHYSHIIHALDDCTTYRVFGTDYFDSMLLSGQHQVEALEGLEAVRNIRPKQKIIVGCSYLDALQRKLEELQSIETSKTLEKGALRILVAPSWGPNGLLVKYGMKLLHPLLQSGYQLIVRPHPQSKLSEAEMLEELQLQCQDFGGQLRWDFERENIHAFLASDALISDFSSVIYDYLFLMQQPVFIPEFEFNYDGYDAMDLLPHEPWGIRAGRKIGIAFSEENIDRLPSLLQEQLANPQVFMQKIEDLKNCAWQHAGEAGKRAVQAIVEIRDSARINASTLQG